MDFSSLNEIGLTEGEVKAYLALLRLGASKTGAISSSAEVSNSKIYPILSRLEKKGLVSHSIKGGVAYFRALEPKRILDYIDEEKERLNEKRGVVEGLIPSLMKQASSSSKAEATVYYGFKAISNFFRGILDELDAGDEYYVIGAGYFNDTPQNYRFFYKYHQLRAQKKIKVKMLANSTLRDTLVPTTKLVSDIRYLPEFLMTSLQITFYGHKTLLTIRAQEPFAFLIESEEVAASFKKYFNTFWKMAEK